MIISSGLSLTLQVGLWINRCILESGKEQGLFCIKSTCAYEKQADITHLKGRGNP